jgi:hypothetical protein
MRLLFAEAMAPGQIYRGSPMSLLYAIAPLYRDLLSGEVQDTSAANLCVQQPESLDGFLQVVGEYRPHIVGLSATTYGIAFARAAASGCKRLDPEIQVVVGGPHFDGLYGHYRGDPTHLADHVDKDFDVIISGQAEWALACLVRLAAAWPRVLLVDLVSQSETALAEVDGRFAIWWREFGSLRILSSPRPQPRKAARGPVPGPFPPRHILPASCEHQFSIFRDQTGRHLRTAQVLTYRGCLFAANPDNACTFCFAANDYQRFPLQQPLAELRALSESGYKAVFFDDAVFTSPSRARKAELLQIARSLRQLKFEAAGFQTRADYLDREVLHILSVADCRLYCSLGIESADPRILQIMGKKQSLDAVASALALLREFNVSVGVYLLFGALGEAADGCRTPETERTAEATINFVARQMDQSIPVVCALPGVSMILPGTRDARRYSASVAQRHRPVRFDICHEGDPWDKFEGGLGMHAPGVTPGLLAHIGAYGQRQLGHVWPGADHD